MAAAEERDVDLIVLGRRGSGGFPSLPIGTTTHHVAAASGRPIAVVPSVVTATSDRLVERVIVGLDGLQGSAEAAAWSAQEWPDARFTAVHVVELAPVLTQLDDDGAGAEFHERAFARAHSLLRDYWSRPLREAGVAFNVSVKEGGPAEMLLDMAARVEADLLVVGRRGVPTSGTLGGVSQRVLVCALPRSDNSVASVDAWPSGIHAVAMPRAREPRQTWSSCQSLIPPRMPAALSTSLTRCPRSTFSFFALPPPT